jgi:hypothetical protein
MSRLEHAALTIRDKADSLPSGETVTDLAHTAADKLTVPPDTSEIPTSPR